MEILHILNSLTWIFLFLLGMEDLAHKQLSVAGLSGMSLVVLIRMGIIFVHGDGIILCLQGFMAGSLFLCCWIFARKEQLGWGDLWMLVLMALWLDIDLFCRGMILGMIHLAMSAAIYQTGMALAKKKDQGERIPVIPYVILGILLSL